MPRIYREAFKVIVWLGDGIRHRITNSSDYGKPPSRVIFYGDDRDDKQVAAFIQKWSVPRPSVKHTVFDVYCFIRMFMMQDSEDCSLAQLHPSHLLRLAEALRMMLLSQWWTRMWVFQEVVVADVATVLHHYSKTLSDIGFWRGFWNKESSRPRRDNTNDLLGLLRATATRKASGDRDRVFALLGLLDLGSILVPDYQMSPAEVFMSVCWANIQETRTLDVLCGDLGRKNRSDLPSWTMDWSATVSESDEARLNLLAKYKSCGDHQANAILGPEALTLGYSTRRYRLFASRRQDAFCSSRRHRPTWRCNPSARGRLLFGWGYGWRTGGTAKTDMPAAPYRPFYNVLDLLQTRLGKLLQRVVEQESRTFRGAKYRSIVV